MLVTGGQLTLQDPDPGQAAFVPLTGQAGTYGTFTLLGDGSWTYEAENALAQIQQLGTGDRLTDTVTVSSVDGTFHDITVTILGTDDAPVVTGGTGTISELDPNVDALIGGLTDAGNPDLGLHLQQVPPQVQEAVAQEVLWEIQQNPKDFGIPPGQAMHLADLEPKFVARWSDTINDIVLQKLQDLGYHPSMGQGLVDTQALPASRLGDMIDTPAAEAEFIEISGQLTIRDADFGDQGFQADRIDGRYGTLEIAADGQWRYAAHESQGAIQALGPDQHLTDVIEVTTVDGHRSDVTITIEGAIDAPTLSVQTVAAGQTSTETVTAGLSELSIDAVEDQPIALNLSGHLGDADPNEILTFTLSGLPAGARVTNATLSPDGAWHVPATTLGQVEVTPPADFNGRIDILIEATAEIAGEIARSDLLLHVEVAPEGHGALITGTDSGSVTEDLDVIQGALITFGVLDIRDPEAGRSAFVPQTDLSGTYGSFALAADGRWTYSALNSQAAIQALGVGDRLTDSVTISSVDGTTHDLTVMIHGSNDGPVLTADPLEAYEDGPVVTGHLTGSDIDVGKTLAYRLEGTAPAGFALLADGSWRFDPSDAAYQSLGEGDQRLLQIPVSVTDEQGAQASAMLEITVVGQNDQPVVSRAVTLPDGYEDSARIITPTQLLAMMQDPDAGDGLHVIATPIADHGTVSPNVDGSWTFQPDADYAGPVTFTFEGGDNHGAVVSATAIMDVKPVGDPALIAGADRGAVTEDMVPIATGQLTVSDPDTGEATFTPVSGETGSGGYGRFFLEETGQWRYELDSPLPEVQALVPGRTLEDSLAVTSADGTSHDLIVTISGTEDAPVITGIDSGALTEDLNVTQGALITFGKLDIIDPDAGEAAFVPQTDIAGSYGSFALAADGRWTYSALNGQVAIQGLGSGDSLTDSVTITSVDGTPHDLTVTIAGSNMGPVASPADLGTTPEDLPRTFTTAELLQAASASDPDGDALSIAGVNVDAAHGTVTDNGDGSFTFTPAADFARDAVPLSVTISDSSEQVTVPAMIDVTEVTDGTAPRLVLSAQQEVINTGPSSDLGRIEIDQVQGAAVPEFTIEFTVVADPVPDTKNYQGPVVFNMGSPSNPNPDRQNNFLTLWNPGNLKVGGANNYATGLNLGDGDSHRITLTWDSLSGNLNLYDNGALNATMGGYHQGETMPADLYLIVGGKVQHVNSDSPFFYPHEHYEGDIFNLAMVDHKLSDGQVAAGPLASQVSVEDGLLVDVRSVGGQIIDAAGIHSLSEFGGLSMRTMPVDTGLAVPPPGAMLQLEIDPGTPTDPDDRVTGVVVSGFLAGTVVSDGTNAVTVSGPAQEINLAGWATDAMTAQLPPGDNSDFDVALEVESTGPDGSVTVTALEEPVMLDLGAAVPAPAPQGDTMLDDAPEASITPDNVTTVAERGSETADAEALETLTSEGRGAEGDDHMDAPSVQGDPDVPEGYATLSDPTDPYLTAIGAATPPEAGQTHPLPDTSTDPYADALGVPAEGAPPLDGVDGAQLVGLDDAPAPAGDDDQTLEVDIPPADDMIDTDPSDPPPDDHQG
ncbi:VCBS [Salipiger bermudensis HTCC2601]|uniref:VCBS n=2 Tax=Salipiger TaxID=263377 RepID=Q0FT74_SALBH|nr:VCBS [Salipiger bermudensis HTCC2601]